MIMAKDFILKGISFHRQFFTKPTIRAIVVPKIHKPPATTAANTGIVKISSPIFFRIPANNSVNKTILILPEKFWKFHIYLSQFSRCLRNSKT